VSQGHGTKKQISEEPRRFAMRDSHRRAQQDEMKRKTMFLHRSMELGDCGGVMQFQLLTWLTDPPPSSSSIVNPQTPSHKHRF
jgi:hypothetical protein